MAHIVDEVDEKANHSLDDGASKDSPVDSQSRITLHDEESVDLGPVDYGWVPWLQVLAGHLVDFISYGYITSYGLFQAYYTDLLDMPPSAIAWIGSVQIFLVFFLCTFSTRAVSAGPWKFRTVVIVGLALQVVGTFATAECKTYWQLFLAQGLCQGIGMGLSFPPIIALVWLYFDKYRAVAAAGIASGTSTGGVVFPLIARQMMQTVGFKWTVRTMGFVILLNSVLIAVLMKPRPTSSRSRKIVDTKAFTDMTYIYFGIGMILSVIGLFFGFYYATSYAEDVLHVGKETSLLLLLVINAIGLLGRFLPAWIADRYIGSTNMLVIVALATGALTLFWALVNNISQFWAWVVLYGFFGASVQSLFPPSLANLTEDQDMTFVRVGMMFSFISFGCLIGPPITGALIQAKGGDYLYAQMVMGAIMVTGSVFLLASRISSTGLRLLVKS